MTDDDYNEGLRRGLERGRLEGVRHSSETARSKAAEMADEGFTDMAAGAADVAFALEEQAAGLEDCPVPSVCSRSELVLRRAIMDIMCSPNIDIQPAQIRLRNALIESRGLIEHPEDRCEECRETFDPWHAPTVYWQRATGRAWGGPILCQPCFEQRLANAHAMGMTAEGRPTETREPEEMTEDQSCEHCGRPSVGYALRECSYCECGMCSTCEDLHDDQAACPLTLLQQSVWRPTETREDTDR